MDGISTLSVGVWLLVIGVTLLFFWWWVIRPTTKRYENLLVEFKAQKEEYDKMFLVITEAFEFLSGERSKIFKDLDELKRRVRIYGNETKRKINSRKDRS